MSLIQQIADALSPHVEKIGGDANAYLGRIENELKLLREQEASRGRPDVETNFKFINQRGTFPAGQTRLGGPTLGEVWSVESIAVNGQPNKTPTFTIRTNTGRLVSAIVAEGMGNENVGGDVVILQGEELILETATEGVFDFTLTVAQRKMPRQEPDAGWGVSEEEYEERFRAEHEVERDALPPLGHSQPHAPAA